MQKDTIVKFHQFYRAKNTRRDTHRTLKPHLPRWKQRKSNLSQPEIFRKMKNSGKKISVFFQKIFC